MYLQEDKTFIGPIEFDSSGLYAVGGIYFTPTDGKRRWVVYVKQCDCGPRTMRRLRFMRDYRVVRSFRMLGKPLGDWVLEQINQSNYEHNGHKAIELVLREPTPQEYRYPWWLRWLFVWGCHS